MRIFSLKIALGVLLLFLFLIFIPDFFLRESGRGTNMICRTADVPFSFNGDKLQNLSIMAGNYTSNTEFMPKFGRDGDLDWFSDNDILTLNFHPQTLYKSSRGWGKWADNQHWAYIGISQVYHDESIAGTPKCGISKGIKLPEPSAGRLHFKLDVKAFAGKQSEHLLEWPFRVGGTIADNNNSYTAENMVEIDNMPNIGRSINNAECYTFDQDWGASYSNFQYGDWVLKNNKWTEIDIDINKIALYIKKKCDKFSKANDIYLIELVIGPEFKVGDGNITIQIKNFEIYFEPESN